MDVNEALKIIELQDDAQQAIWEYIQDNNITVKFNETVKHLTNYQLFLDNFEIDSLSDSHITFKFEEHYDYGCRDIYHITLSKDILNPDKVDQVISEYMQDELKKQETAKKLKGEELYKKKYIEYERLKKELGQ